MTATEIVDQEHQTKTKILSIALDLFAEHGFNGTSVRMLASAAGVNLSAINYHFENKENLYREVILFCHMGMSEAVDGLEKSQPGSAADFCVDVYDLMLARGSMVTNTFKIFISGNQDLCAELMSDSRINGPPGALAIGRRIQKEKPQASEKEVIWAIRMCLSLILHNVVIMSGYSAQVAKKAGPFRMSPDEMRESIRRASQVLLDSIG